MRNVVLLPDGSLNVPDAVLDPAVGGIAHTVHRIGPDHPDYEHLKSLAVREGTPEEPDTGQDPQQADLAAFLRDHRREGDSMLALLEWQVQHRTRRAS
ncbi:hypothetical protein AB0C84_44390 [Actinomadura sp. NPDC048955]|uniref:hypothetical protein n=1 Tax=Actinomadura sp. NPDC048955 TaxID=3158228 RepID=UPI00340EFC81